MRVKLINLVVSVATGLFALKASAANFSVAQQSDRLVISDGTNHVAHFVFGDTNTLRPYFAHVRTPDGIQVTRNHPPIAGQDPVDHPTMHPGIWLAFGDINGQDFWRNKATIRHDKFLGTPKASDGALTFATSSSLLTTNREVIATVEQMFALRAEHGGYSLDWQAKFTPTIDRITFCDQEEMGFGIRIATPISEKNGGSVKNSEGLSGAKNTWGKTASWCDYSGTLSNRLVGIAVMSDPKNFRPSWSHSRDYGLIVANPFGQKAFTKSEPSSIPVGRGETFSLRFGAFIHSNPTNESPNLSAAYEAFTHRK